MNRRRGAIFVLTLVVLTGLVVLVTGIAASRSLEVKAQETRMHKRRAQLMAEAGIQRALSELETQSPTATNLQDPWAILGTKGDDKFIVGNDSFRLEILDACSLININSAPEAQLLRLPLTQEQIDSLLDWRTAGQEPRAEGAKDSYYNGLLNPYNTKLGALDSVDELLLVRGFTPQALYQRSETVTTNQQPLVQGGPEVQPILADILTTYSVSQDAATDGAKVNVNTANQQQLQQLGLNQNQAQSVIGGRPYTSINRLFQILNPDRNTQTLILDRMTTGGAAVQQGRVNINTASEATLNSLPGFTADVTANLLSLQATGFTRASDILNVPGITSEMLAQMADRISINSQVFLVRVIGTAGTTSVSLVGIAVLENNGVRLMNARETVFPDMRERWGWAEETQNEITLSETP